jgi:hypothetical protein
VLRQSCRKHGILFRLLYCVAIQDLHFDVSDDFASLMIAVKINR